MALVVTITTTDEVVELRNKNPQMSASEIARRIGVTRERVRQILVKLGLPTKFPLAPRLCSGCGTPIKRDSRTGLCIVCLHKSHLVTLVCDECGKQYTVLRGEVNARQKHGYKRQFCSRGCRGKWVGKHYGFGARPWLRGKGSRKWDWDMVWQRHLETGYGCSRLSSQLGIPESTISAILSRMSGEMDYNSAIAQLWAKYRKEKAKLIVALREKYEEKARHVLYKKYRYREKGGGSCDV